MDADENHQSQSSQIGQQTRQHGATLLGKVVQCRMNVGRVIWGGPKRSHRTPNHREHRQDGAQLQSCLAGVSRIEALPLPFSRKAGTRHFSSESERWVTKSRWSERPAMSGGKCSTFSTNANFRRMRWWRWRHAAAWASKCRMATAP